MTDERWQRLGRLLVERRVELGYTNRTRFASDKGFKNTRVLAAIENAERTNFDATTITSIELAYGWRLGSIKNVLDGGDPSIAPARETGQADGSYVIEAEIADDSGTGSALAHITVDERGNRVVVGQIKSDPGRLELRYWPDEPDDRTDNRTLLKVMRVMGDVFDQIAVGVSPEESHAEFRRHLAEIRPAGDRDEIPPASILDQNLARAVEGWSDPQAAAFAQAEAEHKAREAGYDVVSHETEGAYKLPQSGFPGVWVMPKTEYGIEGPEPAADLAADYEEGGTGWERQDQADHNDDNPGR